MSERANRRHLNRALRNRRSDSADPQQQQNAHREERERQKHEDNMQIVSALNRVADELMTTEKQEKSYERGKAYREYLTIFLVFGTVMAAGIGDVFFAGQLREMQKSTADTQKTVDANVILAKAAQQSAAAAKTQADAAKQAASFAHDNMVAEQRAWVGPNVGSIEGTITAGTNLNITINYQNTGREPATAFIESAQAFVLTVAEDRSGISRDKINANLAACLAMRPIPGAQVVYPTTGFSNNQLHVSVDKSLIDDGVIKGDKIVLLVGCFTYQTVSTPHHSAFCFFYKAGNGAGPQSLGFCPGGSYAD